MVVARTKKSTKSNKTTKASSPSTKALRKPSIKASSAKVHSSKTRARSSRLARSKNFSRKSFRVTRNIVITVIVLAMIIVVLSVFFSHITSPENIVHRKIEEITADYYENYWYDIYSKAVEESSDKTIADSLSHYSEKGLNKVTLRTLLLFDGERNASSASTLTHYCDENDTFVKIYPTAPYGKKDYRVEYNYSCIF